MTECQQKVREKCQRLCETDTCECNCNEDCGPCSTCNEKCECVEDPECECKGGFQLFTINPTWLQNRDQPGCELFDDCEYSQPLTINRTQVFRRFAGDCGDWPYGSLYEPNFRIDSFETAINVKENTIDATLRHYSLNEFVGDFTLTGTVDPFNSESITEMFFDYPYEYYSAVQLGCSSDDDFGDYTEYLYPTGVGSPDSYVISDANEVFDLYSVTSVGEREIFVTLVKDYWETTDEQTWQIPHSGSPGVNNNDESVYNTLGSLNGGSRALFIAEYFTYNILTKQTTRRQEIIEQETDQRGVQPGILDKVKIIQNMDSNDPRRQWYESAGYAYFPFDASMEAGFNEAMGSNRFLEATYDTESGNAFVVRRLGTTNVYKVFSNRLDAGLEYASGQQLAWGSAPEANDNSAILPGGWVEVTSFSVSALQDYENPENKPYKDSPNEVLVAAAQIICSEVDQDD